MRVISTVRGSTALLMAAWLAMGIARGEEIASGLAVGGHPSPLSVHDCTGPAAGKTLCYTCRYAERPTIAIFAREFAPAVARLAQRIDAQLAEHRDERLAAYVVIIAQDDAELETSLKQAAKEHDLRHVPLTILRERPAKLASSYRLADEAAVTVTQWRDGTVTASRGFTTGELSDAEIDAVVADIATILD